MKGFIVTIFFTVLTSVFSCFFDAKNGAIDSFYTKRIHLDFSRLPLAKPIFIYYDKTDKNWFYEIPRHFKNRVKPYGMHQVGVEKTFIYGKIKNKKQTLRGYKITDYVFLNKFGSIYIPLKPRKPEKDEIRIYPEDSTSKTFILPERWFVLNIADSSTTAFFSKKKYEDYLKAKGISGKMYDIDKYHKQYKETGILPWFPDSIKVKLRK